MIVIFQSPLFTLDSVCLIAYSVFKKINTFFTFNISKQLSQESIRRNINHHKAFRILFTTEGTCRELYCHFLFTVLYFQIIHSQFSESRDNFHLDYHCIFSIDKNSWSTVGVQKSLFSERMKQTEGRRTTNLCCHWNNILILGYVKIQNHQDAKEAYSPVTKK